MKSRYLLYLISFWVIALLPSSCAYNDISKLVDCSKTDLGVQVDGKVDPSLCNAIDGSITVSATGGEPPYAFSINGGNFQSSNVFSNLGPGLYSLVAKGSKGCSSLVPVQVELIAPNSTLTASFTVIPDSDCSSNNGNGSISVTASLGKPPYQFQFKEDAFGAKSTFKDLIPGVYKITVRDTVGCPKVLSITVPRANSGISYASKIKPILDKSCNVAGCHNGDLGASRDWRSYATTKSNAVNIKARTIDKSMPPGAPLTQIQIDQITCWVDDGALDN